ncbi:MarR family winged helix-turn-helix transcriptional regulator [Kitasatospora sp. NPDC059571]|uniref:MarR family winged helix-turn-helix transcriptional regulator n=1 Tax=Kitasatospora sp. NPDC059571 TaxID=3346871 RepID=UPI0036797646
MATGSAAKGQDGGDAAIDRRAFGRLLQALASEMNLLGHDFAAAQGLHTTDVNALLAIMRASEPGSAGPMTPGRLRDELALTSGAVTAVLDRLERAGHVHRSRDGADRRQVQVHYDQQAGSLAARWFTPVAEATDTVRAEFDEAELHTVARFLARMTEELATERDRRRA